MRRLGVSGSRCNELERLGQQFGNEALYSDWKGFGGEYGNGVLGENASSGPGVTGTGSSVGVAGSATNGDGVVGTGLHNGVHGKSASASDGGVYGENTGSGYGVGGSSVSGNGVIGTAAGAHAGGGQNNGVIGHTTTSDSGVWGDNTGSGAGVSGTSAHGSGIIGQGSWNGVQGVTASPSASGAWGENTGRGNGVGGRTAGGTGLIGQGGFNGVQGTTANSATSGVWGENTGSGYGVGGKSAGGIGVYGTGSPAARFDGDVIINGGSIRMQSGGDVIFADFEEDFDALEANLEPGTVMVIGENNALRPCHVPYDKRVAGVISGGGRFCPGIVLERQSNLSNGVPIALIGKVCCKVDASHAAVDVGDLLTTSSTPGNAMKVTEQQKALGSIIGKALASLSHGRGLIPILVALQ
jgi:hypothetical protein